ncbi:MAG: hypothetical protein AB1512_00795 [Thermodesulfobacteriota bacterium]
MPKATPTGIAVEFSDGTRSAVPFDALPTTLQSEILRQPFASKPSSNPEEERYLLLEWDDGWKEVIEVDAACTDLNRYYVISRPEEVGRLSVDRKEGYPELIEIIRKPGNLRRITLGDTFELVSVNSIREGTKVDRLYSFSKRDEALSEWVQCARKAMSEEGIGIQELQSGTPSTLRQTYERIRRRMCIQAGQRQQDVYDFMAYLARLMR